MFSVLLYGVASHYSSASLFAVLSLFVLSQKGSGGRGERREKRRRRERRVELLTRCTPLPAEVNPCTASVLLHSCTGPAFHSSSLPSSTASSSSSPPFFPALPLSLTLSLFFPLPAVTHNTDLLNLHMHGQRAFKN